jgi:hypothetical protein
MRSMTVFGYEVWVLAAKRGITTQRQLTRLITEATGERISHDAVSNYLFGRSVVSYKFPKALAEDLRLDKEERARLADAFTYHLDEEATFEGLPEV